MKVLECFNLYKNIGGKNIISNVSFDIEEGEILGFVGHNGAGKTTIIKMILGLYDIDMGSILINNYRVKDNLKEYLKSVGAIIENPDSYMYLSGYDNLSIEARNYDIDKNNIENVVKLVKLEDNIYDKVKTYSLGMRQRLGIAKALLHNPKLLILDEPTNGLDPMGIRDLREIIHNLAYQEHKAILISSHILNELDNICNKVCIINKGRVVYYGKLNVNDNYYKVRVSDSSKIRNVEYKRDKDGYILIYSECIDRIIEYFINIGIRVFEVKKVRRGIEELYMESVNNDKANL